MVTEIIKQDDIKSNYLDIRYWIECGITTDAQYVSVNQWDNINQVNSLWTELRNKRYHLIRNIYHQQNGNHNNKTKRC